MELGDWVGFLVGCALLVALLVVTSKLAGLKAEGRERRAQPVLKANDWRLLQGAWQRAPGARLATVHHVHESSRRGSRAVLVWSDNRTYQEVWFDRRRVAVGDYVLVAGIEPNGVVTRRNLIARADWDAPGWAEHGY